MITHQVECFRNLLSILSFREAVSGHFKSEEFLRKFAEECDLLLHNNCLEIITQNPLVEGLCGRRIKGLFRIARKHCNVGKIILHGRVGLVYQGEMLR